MQQITFVFLSIIRGIAWRQDACSMEENVVLTGFAHMLSSCTVCTSTYFVLDTLLQQIYIPLPVSAIEGQAK